MVEAEYNNIGGQLAATGMIIPCNTAGISSGDNVVLQPGNMLASATYLDSHSNFAGNQFDLSVRAPVPVDIEIHTAENPSRSLMEFNGSVDAAEPQHNKSQTSCERCRQAGHNKCLCSHPITGEIRESASTSQSGADGTDAISPHVGYNVGISKVEGLSQFAIYGVDNTIVGEGTVMALGQGRQPETSGRASSKYFRPDLDVSRLCFCVDCGSKLRGHAADCPR